MKIIAKFIEWLDITITERRMWWRFITNQKKYEKSKMWIGEGERQLTSQVYGQVLQFVRQTVNLSPRPYGKGSYSLKIAAVWEEEEKDLVDTWQTEFLYQGREAIYTQLRERMENWRRPPDAIMAGVLPYGSLAEGL